MAKKFLRLVNGTPRGDFVDRLASPGGINYIGNYNAESDASGWVTYADAAGAMPVDGTGGSPNVTFTRSTSSPLMEVASFVFVKDAANRQGQGVSYDFTIDAGMQGQQLGISMLQQLTSGVYTPGDVGFYIYDVTNGVVIQPTAFQLNATSIPGVIQNAVWQAASNSVSYRLCFHVATVSTSTYTLKFDNIYVGPSVQNIGVVSKMPTITTLTTGSGTYVPPKGVVFIEVHVVGAGGGGGGSGTGSSGGAGTSGGTSTFGSSFISCPGGGAGGGAGVGGTGGTPSITLGSTGAQTEISMTGNGGRGAAGSGSEPVGMSGNHGGAGPFGGTPNTNYFGASNAAVANSGSGGSGAGIGVTAAGCGAGGGAGAYAKVLVPNTASGFSSGFAYAIGAKGLGGAAGTSGYAGGDASNGVIIIREHYYGSNVALSSDASTRNVVFQSSASSPSVTGGGATTKLTGFSALVDDVGAFASDRYTVRVPGRYLISGSAATGPGASSKSLIIYKNGVSNYGINISGVSAYGCGSGSIYLNLVAGDYIEMYGYNAPATEGWTVSWSVALQQGPQQIQASTAVEARYMTSAGQAITPSGNIIVWGTKDYDTTNSMNTSTGVYTAPAAGFYNVNVGLVYANNTMTVSAKQIHLYKNGGLHSYVWNLSPAGSFSFPVHGAFAVYLLQGETISIFTLSGEGTNRSLEASTTACWVTISRSGGLT